jgi:hypothetical protein
LRPRASKYGGYRQPYAVKYALGWALSGLNGVKKNFDNGKQNGHSVSLIIADDLHKLWDIEGHGDDLPYKLSQEDEQVSMLWSEKLDSCQLAIMKYPYQLDREQCLRIIGW